MWFQKRHGDSMFVTLGFPDADDEEDSHVTGVYVCMGLLHGEKAALEGS